MTDDSTKILMPDDMAASSPTLQSLLSVGLREGFTHVSVAFGNPPELPDPHVTIGSISRKDGQSMKSFSMDIYKFVPIIDLKRNIDHDHKSVFVYPFWDFSMIRNLNGATGTGPDLLLAREKDLNANCILEAADLETLLFMEAVAAESRPTIYW